MNNTKNIGPCSTQSAGDVQPAVNGWSWYLLCVKPRQEYRAARLLENQRYAVYCPEIWANSSGTQPVHTKQPLFPGYLFLHLKVKGANWNAIRSTRGVRDFVRFGQQAAVVHDSIVDGLQRRIEHSAPDFLPVPALQRGDPVRITEGCFEGLNAIFQYRTGKDRVLVLISLMGRLNEIYIGSGSLELLSRSERS